MVNDYTYWSPLCLMIYTFLYFYGSGSEMGSKAPSDGIIHSRPQSRFHPCEDERQSGRLNEAQSKMEGKSPQNNMEMCRAADPCGNAI